MSEILLILPIVLIIAVAFIVKAILDNWGRQKLAEKGVSEEDLKRLSGREYPSHPLSNIKWGLILIGIGIPLVLDHLFEAISHEGTIGLMAIGAGIGFLIYYSMARGAILRGQTTKRPEPKE